MKKRKNKRGIMPIVIILVPVLAAAFLLFDSAHTLSVTEYDIYDARLPQSFDGFKIVQLSDLHGAEFGKENSRLIEAVRREKPDIIAVTGDIISSSDDLPAAEALVTALAEICDVYFVSGNHDFGSGEMSRLSDVLEKAGIKYLSNEYVLPEKERESIVLAGVEDPNSWEDMMSPEGLAESMAAEHPDKFRILLAHRNDWCEKYPALPVDLILCGHGHGGIVRLPGIGGIFGTGRTLFPEYDAGLFHSGSYDMIVSRGLGNSVPIPRILNRPEIITVNLFHRRGIY